MYGLVYILAVLRYISLSFCVRLSVTAAIYNYLINASLDSKRENKVIDIDWLSAETSIAAENIQASASDVEARLGPKTPLLEMNPWRIAKY